MSRDFRRVWAALAITLAVCSRPRETGRALSPDGERGETRPAAGSSTSELSIAFAGDTMLARGVDELIRERGPRYIWGNALSLIRAPHLTLVNLECVIATSGTPFVPPRVFYFRAAPPAIDALLAAGIDYVSIANNHAMDYEAPALLETLERLDRAGIAHAGAGRNLEQAERPALLRAGSQVVGVVSFADHFSFYGASATKPGTNFISITTEGADFDRVR
ncbi:MAG: CapA family protein, partial [Steroidobacteraceae bacterium]